MCVLATWEGWGLADGCFALVRLEGSQAALAEKRTLLNTLTDDHLVHQLSDSETVVARASSATCFIDTFEDVWLVYVPPNVASHVIVNVDGDWIADWAGANPIQSFFAGGNPNWLGLENCPTKRSLQG